MNSIQEHKNEGRTQKSSANFSDYDLLFLNISIKKMKRWKYKYPIADFVKDQSLIPGHLLPNDLLCLKFVLKYISSPFLHIWLCSCSMYLWIPSILLLLLSFIFQYSLVVIPNTILNLCSINKKVWVRNDEWKKQSKQWLMSKLQYFKNSFFFLHAPDNYILFHFNSVKLFTLKIIFPNNHFLYDHQGWKLFETVKFYLIIYLDFTDANFMLHSLIIDLQKGTPHHFLSTCFPRNRATLQMKKLFKIALVNLIFFC